MKLQWVKRALLAKIIYTLVLWPRALAGQGVPFSAVPTVVSSGVSTASPAGTANVTQPVLVVAGIQTSAADIVVDGFTVELVQ